MSEGVCVYLGFNVLMMFIGVKGSIGELLLLSVKVRYGLVFVASIACVCVC